ncbi:MAG: hypothetical protein AB7U73_01855 [Pirellulales bacterium]
MSTKAKYANGILTHYDPAKKYLWTNRESRYKFHEDFDQLTTIPDDGSRANGCPWVQDITGAAPPTVTLSADHAGGAAVCTLTVDSQAQDATIHFDDNRHVSLDRGAVFQAYLRFTTLPTLLGIGSIGLASDHNAGGMAGTTYCAGFQVSASGAVGLLVDDNVSPITAAAVATLTVNVWYVFRIESFSISGLRFYIDGAVVGGSTAFNLSALTGTANAVLQPFIGMSKASGAGLGVMAVDSVDVWQD